MISPWLKKILNTTGLKHLKDALNNGLGAYIFVNILNKSKNSRTNVSKEAFFQDNTPKFFFFQDFQDKKQNSRTFPGFPGRVAALFL